MKPARFGILVALFSFLAVPAVAQSPVTIQFQNGLVSVTARNAPLRTILAEWARVGGSRIVNGDRVTGAPMTIELTNVTEHYALTVLLRGVSGYIVGARPIASAGTSSFDRILILPTSTTTRQASTPPPTFTPTPTPVQFIVPDPDDQADAVPPARAGSSAAAQTALREAAERARTARAVEEEEEDEPTPTPATKTPASPFGNIQGSSRPGEITPVPRRNPQRPNGENETER